MAILTVTTGMAYIRLRSQDVDATIVDASLLIIINKWYALWTDEINPRIQLVTGTAVETTGTGGISGVLATASVKTQVGFPTTMYTDYLEVGSRRSNETISAPMERVSLVDLRRFLYTDSTVGRPSKWALEPTQTATPGDIGKANLWFWPPASASSGGFSWVLDALARIQVTPLDAATVTTFDTSEADSYRIALLAAAEVAWLLGKDENYINGILSEVGEKGQALVRRWQNIVKPRIAGAPEAV